MDLVHEAIKGYDLNAWVQWVILNYDSLEKGIAIKSRPQTKT